MPIPLIHKPNETHEIQLPSPP